jgi:hypothetical protein
MALNDVQIISQGGQNLPPAKRFNVAASATAILAGEPVKTSTVYVVPSADAEPVTSAPTFAGIAATTSTHTASVAGVVDVYMPVGGVIYACKAKSTATFDTQAEIDALQNALVLFDLTSSVYTVDVAVTGATNGLMIVGGDPTKALVYFVIRSGATILA